MIFMLFSFIKYRVYICSTNNIRRSNILRSKYYSKKIKRKALHKRRNKLSAFIRVKKRPFKLFMTQKIKDELLRVKNINENYNSAQDYYIV